MTASEIFTRIEEKLTALDLIDCFGEPLVGNEVLPTLIHSDPGKLESLQDQVLSGKISWERYGEEMEIWIEEWVKERYRRKLNQKFETYLKG